MRSTLRLPREPSATADIRTFTDKLRLAAFNGVTEEDVKQIVGNLVTKAKAGDPGALKLFFEYVLGGRQAPMNASQTNVYLPRPKSRRDPNEHLDRTARLDKLPVLAKRAAEGKALFPANGNGCCADS